VAPDSIAEVTAATVAVSRSSSRVTESTYRRAPRSTIGHERHPRARF
jgi:hypothetical protein